MQVKRTHTCERGDTYVKGRVYTVYRIDDDGEFWMESPDFGLGKGINVPENFRKYKEPEHYKIGDKVLVGAKGAGYGNVLEDYAGRVCTITAVNVFNQSALVEISHPDVMDGHSYTSKVKHLTPYVAEAEPLEVGDIVELAEDCVDYFGDCIPKGLYKLHKETGSAVGHTNLDTVHGDLGQATVKTELLTKVGVCINPNG